MDIFRDARGETSYAHPPITFCAKELFV